MELKLQRKTENIEKKLAKSVCFYKKSVCKTLRKSKNMKSVENAFNQ